MTAPDRDAEARQELAAALHVLLLESGVGGMTRWDKASAIANAVWPVVERIRERARAEGAADELDRMGDVLAKAHDLGPARRCRNRADKLRAGLRSGDAG
jgi:hypothetical protein